MTPEANAIWLAYCVEKGWEPGRTTKILREAFRDGLYAGAGYGGAIEREECAKLIEEQPGEREGVTPDMTALAKVIRDRCLK